MKKELGQYFTCNEQLLEKVRSLTLGSHGVVLEPSCGAGHIVDYLVRNGETRKFHCIELDATITSLPVLQTNNVEFKNSDFLETQFEIKFQSIVGNPPYVKRKGKRNIYVEFIDKCLDLLDDSGELIFIIPSDFLTLTSATSVKHKMMATGSLTHLYYPNNETLFDKAAQDVVIFRFQKGISSNEVNVNGLQKTIRFHNGNLYITDENDVDEYTELSQIFDVKVGMVSGADKVFKNDTYGNMTIQSSNGTNKYILLKTPPEGEVKSYLISHKEDLMSRRIRKFDDNNWYQWGCLRNVSFMETNIGNDCIYCATLTRKNPVFKRGTVSYFDGSLLCLFPKSEIHLDTYLQYLNSDKFLKNFLYAGRYKVGQKSLSDCHLPTHLQTQEITSNS
jgi:adenine-specific DNA-methyltransferase